jgi:hypothetical protein
VYDNSGVGNVTTNYFDADGNEFLPDGTPVYDYGEPEDTEAPPAVVNPPVVNPPVVNPPAVVKPPVVKPPVVKPPVVKPPVVKPPVVKQPPAESGVNMGALLALLAGMGGSRQPAEAPVQENAADIQLMQDIFGPTLDLEAFASKPAKAAQGGSIDDLLRLLRG